MQKHDEDVKLKMLILLLLRKAYSLLMKCVSLSFSLSGIVVGDFTRTHEKSSRKCLSNHLLHPGYKTYVPSLNFESNFTTAG